MKDAQWLLKPGDVVMYSPIPGGEEWPVKVLDYPPDCDANVFRELGEVFIEYSPGNHHATGEKLFCGCFVWEGRLRMLNRDRAETVIRERLSELAKDTLGLEIPEDAWGTGPMQIVFADHMEEERPE